MLPDHRGLPPGRHRRLPARAARELVPRPVPGLRQAGPARDRRERHLPRLGVVLPALPEHRVRRPAVRPGAHAEVAPGHDLHRRQRARRAAPAVRPVHHHGAARPGAPPLRRAVHEVPGARPDREGRRQDVQVAGQRRHPGRVHRPLGRRHVPDVPDVPGAVPGGRRLPRRGHQRAAAVPGQGLGAGGRRLPHATRTTRSGTTCW